ncbi:MAG TPA: NAD(P)/FAD-dependent oxidoreductase [Steroidobacteraceae bacterium]|nr:NAD(P)/FAD-dependent oxidoreductase [Steroidobacteraceae bacterium]
MQAGETLVANPQQKVEIVGAGLAGALLGLLLARRGFAVNLYDRRPDPRHSRAERGRSINLALAARGIRALERAGIMDRIRPLMIPMRGRMIHEQNGATGLQLYGHRENEVIYSVDRGALNRVLIEAAARHSGVALHFEHTCIGVDSNGGGVRFRDSHGSERIVAASPAFATDGAGSAVRASLASSGTIVAREAWLDHDYKELSIPDRDGRHALETNALHIWPRGGFMLIALPNTDGSFTATLFLAREGINSFAALGAPAAVSEFFEQQFPDIAALIPDLAAQFAANPTGRLATVHANPWHSGQTLLLGDAAHAIVPFHGQGMNAAFEDCRVLDECVERRGGRDSPRSAIGISAGPVLQSAQWSELFADFTRSRQPNTAAIAAMALENYTEMRDTVLDPGYVRRKALAVELEKRFPDRFIPRYSMVMFHPEIPYAEAQRRGVIQEEILRELTRDPAFAAGEAPPGQAVSFVAAERLLTERLPPIV